MKAKIILLVEDDELDVISVKRSLKKLEIDYILYTAYNGLEALALLNDSGNPVFPDVILLDLNMPKMNGTEFLRAIRANRKFENIKVFIMTTSSETADRKVTEGIGVAGYIIKPLSYTDNTKRLDAMDSFVQFHLRKILTEA